MIKEKLDKYGNIAFLCNSKKEFIEFCYSACLEMEFTKTLAKNVVFREDFPYISNAHLPMYKDNDKIYALIIVKGEYQFYSRNVADHNQYTDWNEIKIVDYNKINRKKKLIKLKNYERNDIKTY